MVFRKKGTEQDEAVFPVVDQIDAVVTKTTKQVDDIIDPYRKSAFKRFPTLFTLLVTVGVTATLFGLERVLENTWWINEHPLLTACVGVGILIMTGRLYKKLG